MEGSLRVSFVSYSFYKGLQHAKGLNSFLGMEKTIWSLQQASATSVLH